MWTDLGTDGDVRWDDVTGVLAYYCGGHLVQPYGETGQWPRLTGARARRSHEHLYGRHRARRVGVVDHPSASVLRATDTTTSTSAVTIDASVDLGALATALRRIAPRAPRPRMWSRRTPGSASGVPLTPGASKATVHSISVYLEPP